MIYTKKLPFKGNISYTLDQLSLGNEYFGVTTSGSVYIKTSLTEFSSGVTLGLTATARDLGGLEGEYMYK